MTLTPEILQRMKETAEKGGAVVGIDKEQFIELVEMATLACVTVTTRDCGCVTRSAVTGIEFTFCAPHREELLRLAEDKTARHTIQIVQRPAVAGKD